MRPRVILAGTMTQPYPIPRQFRSTDVLVGNGGDEYGPFGFKIFDVEDVVVLLKLDGEEVFSEVAPTVAKAANLPLDDFTVTFDDPVTADDAYIVLSKRLHERVVAVTRGGAVSAVELEKELSKMGSVLQELRRDMNSTVRFAPGFTGNAEIPQLGDAQTIKWDAALERFLPGPTVAEIEAAEGYAEDAQAAAATAVAAAGTATTQAGIATTQAGIATTQAGIATAAVASIGNPIDGSESVKTGNYTIVAGDVRKTIVANSASAIQFALTAAATLGAGFHVRVFNIGAGTLTIDANASELINGVETIALNQYQGATLFCSGTAWRADRGGTGREILISPPTSGDAGAFIHAAIAAAPDNSVIVIKPGAYTISAIPIAASTGWVADGESALDMNEDCAIFMRNRRGLRIFATGCTFTCTAAADGFMRVFYKCIDCVWTGGVWIGNSTLAAGANQASAVVVARCWMVWVEQESHDQFYRNYFGLRSSFCGGRHLHSTGAGYLCLYGSGKLDVTTLTLTGLQMPAASTTEQNEKWMFSDCYVAGGKYGNVFSAGAEWYRIKSRNAGRQGVQAAHFVCQQDDHVIVDCDILETSNQNSGDLVDGIIIGTDFAGVSAGAFPAGRVHNTKIRGCQVGIDIIAARRVSVTGCDVSGYYLAGILGHSRQIAGQNYVADALIFANNNVGAFASGSTLTALTYYPKASIALQSGDAVLAAGIITGNVVDPTALGTIAPTGTWSGFYTNVATGTIKASNNLVRGTAANSLPRGEAGSVIDSVAGSYATNANLATVIPADDSVPQVGEGVEIISVSITPKSTSNKLRLRFSCEVAGDTSPTVASVAFFVDGAANAVASRHVSLPTLNLGQSLALEAEIAVASIAAKTITVRAGGSTGTIIRMNGTSGARLHGGAQVATLVVEEIQG